MRSIPVGAAGPSVRPASGLFPLGVPDSSCLDSRIEQLTRLRQFSNDPRPARERHFDDAIASARATAARGSSFDRSRASAALELLGLEICDQ